MTLDELQALRDAASDGPWTSDGEAVEWTPRQRSPFADKGAGVFTKDEQPIIWGGQQDEQGGAVGVLKNADAKFICAIHDAVKMLEAVEEDVQKAHCTNRDCEDAVCIWGRRILAILGGSHD